MSGAGSGNALADENAKLRRVAKAGYIRLAMDWQSHLFEAPRRSWPPDMSVFSPESYAVMDSADQELFDALKELK